MGPVADFVAAATPGLAGAVARALPGARIVDVVPLAPDAAAAETMQKAAGYGVPLRVEVEVADGTRRRFVLHTASANVFGHDRRADRAAEMLLAYDTFGSIPGHVRAVDVGAIGVDGRLQSLHDAGEFYLLTEYAAGRVYAEDLRRIAHSRELAAGDVARTEALARALATLHAEPAGDRSVYRRSIRDLVGGGEGVAGIVDGYPDGVPAAPPERLWRIQERCLAWRHRLRRFEHRGRRIHGDFHPFNIVLADDDAIRLLDTSRGSAGDPADDVTCLAINYVFFAVEHPEAWPGALSRLWHRFWSTYLAATHDGELLEVAPPFLAWRGLVVANPVWYPAVTERARDRVLGLVERVLVAERFDPRLAEELFP